MCPLTLGRRQKPVTQHRVPSPSPMLSEMLCNACSVEVLVSFLTGSRKGLSSGSLMTLVIIFISNSWGC